MRWTFQFIKFESQPSNPTGSATERASWCSRRSAFVAALILLAAIIHPPHGTGIPLCWFNATTGVPCPGCGMTRSVSCAIRGMFDESWSYHAFGMPFLAGLAFVAVVGALPLQLNASAARQLTQHRRLVHGIRAAVIAAFIIYGAGRAVLFML